MAAGAAPSVFSFPGPLPREYHDLTVDYCIRAYRPADFSTLCAIDRLCYSARIAYTRYEMRWYLNLPRAKCLVAERDLVTKKSCTAIAGFILTAFHEELGHIITIDVLPPHRRRGIGSILLREAEKHLAAIGAKEILLETAIDNEPAIAFWRRHGYRSRGRIKGYYPGGLDAFAMSKRAADSPFEEK